MNNWKNIWGNRNITDLSSLDSDSLLIELIKTNGFDGGSGDSGITVESWNNYFNFIKNQLSIKEDDSIFETGCGCGALLYPFYSNGHKTGGIDYSDKLIKHASSIMPNAELTSGEASEINNTQYDFVISNSIFFYFPDYNYSSIVLKKMYDKAVKGIAILDIPDLKLKEECEQERRSQVPDYDIKYKDLNHLYYEKSFFLNFAESEKSSSFTVTKQNISGYGYNKYRFNCFIKR